MRFLQICSECRIPVTPDERCTRVWEEVRCPLCARFYCRKIDCLKPLAVREETQTTRCADCGTEHHYSGRGAGKVCMDRPILSLRRAKPEADALSA